MKAPQRSGLSKPRGEEITRVATVSSGRAMSVNEQLRSPELIVRNVRESVIVTDLQGTIAYWNEGARALFGYTAEEMIGRTPALIYPDQDEALLTDDPGAIAAGRDYNGEWRGRHKDGTALWIEVTTTQLFGDDGEHIGFIGVAKDITARKRSDERHRLLLAAAEALTATLDPSQTPQRIADLAVPALADWCSVGTLDANGGVVWLGMAHRDLAAAAELGRHGRWIGLRMPPSAEGIFRAAMRTGKTQLVARVSDTHMQMIARGDADYLAFLRALGAVSLVAVPLQARGRLVGVIVYMALGEDRAYTPAHLPALEDLARRAGLALDVARLHDEARRATAVAEARARELEATFEAMADGVIVYGPSGQAVHINGTARTLFGIDLPHDATALFDDQHGRAVRVRDAAGRPLAPEEQVPDRVLRGEVLTGERSVTFRLTAPDGRERAVEASGTPLHDAAGAVVGAVIVYRDVTERRAAELALRQQAALLALAPDAIIVRAPEGLIVRWNMGAEALYGWTGAEAEGMVTHELLRTRVVDAGSAVGLARGATGRETDAILAAAGAWTGTLEHKRRDGTRVVVESRQALLRDESGSPVAILEINRDLTAREAFLAGLAHDLKTPLTGILGQAQLAARRLARLTLPEAEPVKEHVAQVQSAARSLTRMIDELADMTRLRMDAALNLHRRSTDLVALMRAVVAQQEGLTGHRLTVVAAVPAVEVLLDAPRMERVLGNLLANAIKYSPDGTGVTVQLALTEDERGPGVTIAVEDHGVGIPAADLPRIFERFYRARNVAATVPGTGLGLATAREVLAQHGGTITADSTEGEGTTMRVWLPGGRSAPREGPEEEHNA